MQNFEGQRFAKGQSEGGNENGSRDGSRLYAGGQGRNRTVDTRIFNTTQLAKRRFRKLRIVTENPSLVESGSLQPNL